MKDVEKSVSEHTSTLLKGWLVYLMGTLAFLSFTIFIIFTWTNVFRDAILSNLVIRNGSDQFKWWQRPPVRAIYKIRIFNYTNFEEFKNNDSVKLKVQEVGPYIYREHLVRRNPVFYDNGTVSYQEERRFVYEGGRPEDEVLTVPNYFSFFAEDKVKPFYMGSTFLKFANKMSTYLSTFKQISARDYIFGNDKDILTKILLDLLDIPVEKAGLLALKEGLSKNNIVMHTGEKDLRNLGVFDRVNGVKYRDIWGNKDCDRISGTDGTMFPPHLINEPNSTLYVYAIDMCRVLPLQFEGHSFAHGLPTYRYRPADDFFRSSPEKDSCFCHNITNEMGFTELRCPAEGLFNVSKCAFNWQFLASFPHFYRGDKSLLNIVDGLRPQKELHESYVDVHPRLAVPIDGWSRLQINVGIKTPQIFDLKDIKILPLIWIEIGVDSLPDDILSLLHHAFYTVNAAEATLQWGSLICLIFCIWYLVRILSTTKFRKPKILQRNTSGQGPLIE